MTKECSLCVWIDGLDYYQPLVVFSPQNVKNFSFCTHLNTKATDTTKFSPL